jgi:phage tail sheath protein FI
LGLEKEVRYIAKYFKYDQITDYLMIRFVDAITPIFEEAKNKGGLKEYFILCDRNNNTVQTIENNELHCTIGVKPLKSGEFICLNFICTNQSADVQEIVQNY